MNPTAENQAIAKEIIIALINNKGIQRSEYPDAKTYADAVGAAYRTLLKSVAGDSD